MYPLIISFTKPSMCLGRESGVPYLVVCRRGRGEAGEREAAGGRRDTAGLSQIRTTFSSYVKLKVLFWLSVSLRLAVFAHFPVENLVLRY